MLRQIRVLSRSSPYLVLALSLMGTLGTVFYAFQAERLAGEGRFREQADQVRYQLAGELRFYASVLMQTRSFFQGEPAVSGEGFLAYVEGAGFLHHQKALVGVGYARRAGKGFPIRYFVESSRLPTPLGYDPYSEAERRTAMDRARDSGEPALTGRTDSVRDNDAARNRLVMFVAVYRRGARAETVAQRRAALLGFVFAPLRISSIFEEISLRKPEVAHALDFSLFDGHSGWPEKLVYASAGGTPRGARFEHVSSFEVGGHTWQIHSRSTPRFEHDFSRATPWFVLVLGLFASVLVFLLLRLTQSGRKAVEKSEEQLRLISDALPDLIAYVDADYRFRFNNRAYEDWFGRSRAELDGLPLAELFPADAYVEIKRCLERAFSGKTCRYTGTSESVKKGRRIVDALMIPDLRADGTCAGVVTLFTDVTERRLAQDQLMEEVRVTEALNRVGARLAGRLDVRQLMQDVADIGTEITGAEVGAIFYVTSSGDGANPLRYAACAREPKFLESARPELRWDAEALRRENLPRLSRNAARETLADGHPFRVLFGSTIEAKSYLSVPMVSRVGQVVGLVAFGHRGTGVFDERAERFAEGLAAQAALALGSARLYTELEEANHTKDQSLRELARSNSELQQFAYIASHDLKEPLRMVTSYVRLIERRFSDQMDQDGREYVRFAVDGATRMQALINDLLLYSRVGTEGLPLSANSSEHAVSAAVANLRTAIEESSAQVIWRDLPTVASDPTQLTQLFQNLIGNAIKYRRDEPPRIEIAAVREDKRWRFTVKDNGIGIEAPFWERIFVIFQRLHPRGKYPGTGIGLAICKKIVERHGGEIHVVSAVDVGSTFIFTLPEAPAVAAADGASSAVSA